MTLDVARLGTLIAEHGRVARVLVVEARGSVPRGAGTSMILWDGGMEGTIGGGALEWQAIDAARSTLRAARAQVLRLPLGPALGQCCGGAVTLVIECLDVVPPVPWIRQVEARSAQPSLSGFAFRDGWLREEGKMPPQPVWIWGAGHVGRALVGVLAPLPHIALTWVDDALDRYPNIPEGVTQLPAADMPRAMAHAPEGAAHLILTYSHEIDLALCHAALTRGFGFCGLIGSATKWARFRSRLAALGHAEAVIARITCPIGDPALGKHPQAIAVGVAASLLSQKLSAETTGGTTA